MALPSIQQIVFDHLAAEQNARNTAQLDGLLRTRASSAGKCARAVAFQITSLPASNPPEGESLVNFYIGDAVHDVVQTAIVNYLRQNQILERWPQIEVEGSIEDYITGHCDVIYFAEDGGKVVCEIKSVSDFAFELATGATLKSNGRWRKKERQVEGPKREHKLQAGIYGRMFDAPYLAIVYVRKTAAKDEPVFWEWRFVAPEFENEIDVELERQRTIVNMVRNSRMPDREFEEKIIVNPNAVKFPCGYCQFKSACIALGPGEVEIK